MTAVEEAPARMMTPGAAAKRTGIPVSVIRRAMAEHALPYLQPNGPKGWRLIEPKDLEEWVASIKVSKK